jgi:UDP-glucose 4,6-dehydratase
MPFCDLDDDKDYLGKILKYDKLVNYKNSVTYIPDLVLFIEEIIDRKDIPYGIYNIVNTYGINCEEIYDIAKNFTKVKFPKKWYTGDELLSMGIMKCRRSNCVLDNNKASQYCSFFDARTAVKIALEEHFEHNEK